MEPDEDDIAAAGREFEEETGLSRHGPFTELTPVKQKGGKVVRAWVVKGDCDPTAIVSITFTAEWPRKSGRQQEFPEIHRAEFFDLETTRRKTNTAQAALIDELEKFIKHS